MGPQVFHEHPTLIGLGALGAQIRYNGTARFPRKRKGSVSPVLAGVQLDGTAPPVNVLEAEVSNLTGPKPQSGETPHDRTISLPTGCGYIHLRKHLLELIVL
jgi:hypothetical protein